MPAENEFVRYKHVDSAQNYEDRRRSVKQTYGLTFNLMIFRDDLAPMARPRGESFVGVPSASETVNRRRCESFGV